MATSNSIRVIVIGAEGKAFSTGHDLKEIGKKSEKKFYEYGYLRKNPAGSHRELWYHEQGDRSWLVVTRNTISHEIEKVELARDIARKKKAKAK